MVILKKKIKIINSLPDEKKKKVSIISILFITIISIILLVGGYYIYDYIFPYINSINVNKIAGKKVNYSKCNTKDYIIIEKDKSFTMSLTDINCKTEYFEGDLLIKNNQIIFNNKITGIINSDYNIIINNELFESEKNE